MLDAVPRSRPSNQVPRPAPCRGSRPTRAYRGPTLRRCLAGPRGWSQAAWSHQVGAGNHGRRRLTVPQSDGEGVSAAADSLRGRPSTHAASDATSAAPGGSSGRCAAPSGERQVIPGARIHACADQKRKFTARPNQSASAKSARPSTLPRQSAHESSSGSHSTE